MQITAIITNQCNNNGNWLVTAVKTLLVFHKDVVLFWFSIIVERNRILHFVSKRVGYI